MKLSTYIRNGLAAATAIGFVAAPHIPGTDRTGPVLARATELFSAGATESLNGDDASGSAMQSARRAVDRLASSVRPLSHPRALEVAFGSYFAYRQMHPDKVSKPYLYFVDFGLPATKPRGYVFDMNALKIIEGPFMVAQGRGSSSSGSAIASRFSNKAGSEATSLGLYRASETYAFHGKTGGRRYQSIGLRLDGLSGAYNDNARARRVVVHGAPYVTPNRAGRSEGCPAMAPDRARRLIPKLANGGMVFQFAPVSDWLSHDPWIAASDD